MSGTISLGALNALDRNAFVATLSNIFERSPWVAAAVFDRRPFASVAALHGAMVDAMRQAGHDRQRALILAHPELGTKKTVTEFSRREQASARVDVAEGEERAQLAQLNIAYHARFGFPFIMAVTGKSPAEILAAMKERLTHSEEIEFDTALDNIARIARIRLDAMIAAP